MYVVFVYLVFKLLYLVNIKRMGHRCQ